MKKNVLLYAISNELIWIFFFDFHAWVKSAILAIFENSEKLPLALSMCLFMWIKVDK